MAHPFEQVSTPAAWRFRALALPSGYHGARGIGLVGDFIVGNATTSAGKVVAHAWRGDEVRKLPTIGRAVPAVKRARGVVAAGVVAGRRTEQAAMWRLAAEGIVCVGLHPKGYERSVASGTDGGTIVGSGIRAGEIGRAPLRWSPEPGELPPAAWPSGAIAVDGPHVVGTAVGDEVDVAVLWTGDAPPRELRARGHDWSSGRGVGDGEQVGCVARSPHWQLGDVLPALWRGSSDSFVSLLPSGFGVGEACDCAAGLQVGWARAMGRGSMERALLWGGGPESVVDLHAATGGHWTTSRAVSVHRTLKGLVVVGEVSLRTSAGVADTRVAVWETDLS